MKIYVVMTTNKTNSGIGTLLGVFSSREKAEGWIEEDYRSQREDFGSDEEFETASADDRTWLTIYELELDVVDFEYEALIEFADA